MHKPFTSEESDKIKLFAAEAAAFLHEDADEGSTSTSNTMFENPEQLVDMLMNPRAGEVHYDDAGPIIYEDSERWRRAQTSGVPLAPPDDPPQADPGAAAEAGGGSSGEGGQAAAGGQQGGADPEETERRARAQARQQQRQEMQRQILEGLQAVFSGMEAVARGTEAIERELENVIGIINTRAGGARARPKPPASRRLIASLPIVDVTEGKLAEWGKDHACPVCTCELEVGEQVQVLPCSHIYHPGCVAPWLEKHNSCPTCRKELPTDDPHYEAQKEKEAEEEEERRGAANAVRGGEFMYV
eukprot:CAMPEP_0202909756 /NCGR_PEP_ID=MMETSP1392-20130828/50217_1 /ASSEMBLY_ACC=CAM_ASM_000868 /TAXON_ID=225041 /ORGANISM="Chlamydomonas chlamydogama, Strain SAG 11-48b" /LENGTH=300 /DNA_ID=CAMNT_0049599615 /DNA_START=234 /DNA_END=1136 /DNA_ORIENTATION=-